MADPIPTSKCPACASEDVSVDPAALSSAALDAVTHRARHSTRAADEAAIDEIRKARRGPGDGPVGRTRSARRTRA